MKIYTVEEIARDMGIPESALDMLIKSGTLEMTRSPKGEILITQEQLDKFMGVKKC